MPIIYKHTHIKVEYSSYFIDRDAQSERWETLCLSAQSPLLRLAGQALGSLDPTHGVSVSPPLSHLPAS